MARSMKFKDTLVLAATAAVAGVLAYEVSLRVPFLMRNMWVLPAGAIVLGHVIDGQYGSLGRDASDGLIGFGGVALGTYAWMRWGGAMSGQPSAVKQPAAAAGFFQGDAAGALNPGNWDAGWTGNYRGDAGALRNAPGLTRGPDAYGI